MISRRLQLTVLILLVAVFGMGVYVLQTKRRTEQLGTSASDSRPMAPPVAGPQETFVLWVASDSDFALHRVNGYAALPHEPAERDREILRHLIAFYLGRTSKHAFGPGADVRAVYRLDNGLAVIDTNADFANRHPSSVLSEALTVASIAQTLSANSPQVKRVRFLVDGKERETLAGHADLLGTYELAELAQAAEKQ